MMELPLSTESLTKLLRSKTITTGEICDIYTQLCHSDYYFPNKEIFGFELINDRWNDQKLAEFKRDHRIWQLYNDLWIRLQNDEVIVKKMFKELKFVPHLIKSLSTVDSDLVEFISQLNRTCKLINSTLTVNVPIEDSISIMGKTVELTWRMDKEGNHAELRNDMIEQMKNLTEIENLPEINAKLANVYCNDMLLPTIQYISRFENQDSDVPIISFLTELLGHFIFGSSAETTRLLQTFVKSKRDELSAEDCFMLYKKSIGFLSKQNFTELERIFVIFVDAKPELSKTLLKELSLSKKTMSNEFLTGLFQKALKKADDDSNYDSEFWDLILQLLNLDIEIGIQNTEILMDLICEHKFNYGKEVRAIWAKILNSHVDARELPLFLKKLKSYCQREFAKSEFLLETPSFIRTVSNHATSLSVVQLKTLISADLKQMRDNSDDRATFLILCAIISGLRSFSYMVLAELKETLSGVFNVDDKLQKDVLQIRYLVMNILDDVIPEWLVESLKQNLDFSVLTQNPSKEAYFYFFKLREYKELDMKPIISSFMTFFSNVNEEEKKDIVRILFQNWGTLINSNFSKEDLSKLISYVLSENNLDLLSELLDDENIFEENNIMNILVAKLSEHHEDDMYLSYIAKIPLQCINKNIRVGLINNFSSNNASSEAQLKALDHLLTYPTFKSNIESDFSSLYKFMDKSIQHYKYRDIVFEKIWGNHLSQAKEDISRRFLEQGIEFLSDGIGNKEFEITPFQLSFLVVKGVITTLCESLRYKFIQRAFHWISAPELDIMSLTWLLRCLFVVFSSDDRLAPTGDSAKELLSTVAQIHITEPRETTNDLLANFFLFFTVLYEDKLEYLLAHYLVLRETGIEARLILPGIVNLIEKRTRKGTAELNHALINTINAFSTCPEGFCDGLIELYQVQIEKIEKDNTLGVQLFLRSISEFYTNLQNFKTSKAGIIMILKTLQQQLTNKPWLFSQYCIELFFPMCFEINVIFLGFANNCDDIFSETMKLMSSIIFAHRVKLSNRHHLVNAAICQFLELLSSYQDDKLTSESARSLSRLITNVCEPTLLANQNVKKMELSSKVGMLKKNLRKYIAAILINYIHISTCVPFKASIRKELTPALYSIFDLMSQNEMVLLNAALDYAGIQYLRALYADYKKMGKWNAD